MQPGRTVAVDGFDLQRFVEAQDLVYPAVLAELGSGRKTSHWMWFVFPQVRGLGMSSTSVHYAISGRDEAIAYLAHPVLGPRLLECTGLVNAVEGRSLREIFGSPDDMKFRSSMTLFALAAADPAPFEAALQKYCRGELDPLTVAKLGS
jgi:uncharacterized protein (DUF1810 family)